MGRALINTLAIVVIFAAAHEVNSAPLENETQERTNICGGASGAQDSTKWPRNIVPYTIDSNFTAFARTNLMNSIHHLENVTCVLFIPRTNEQDYVLFKMSTRCCSHYGKMGPGKQEVYFSEHCIQEGVSINRVLQALIGDVDPSSHQTAESDSGSLSAQQNQPQQTDDASSQGCANSCSKRILLQPPSDDNTASSSGVISSPNHPNDYPFNIDCVWKIIAPDGYFINLRFQADMDIEIPTRDGCSYDHLKLFLLSAAGEQLTSTRRFCGNNSASMLNSALGSTAELQTQTVIAHLFSDATHSGRGFQFNYTLQADHSNLVKPCSINNGGCEHNCSNNDGNTDVTCSCRDGYTLAEDGHSCTDIDECALKYKEGGCHQRCTNTAGSYQCFCKPGYRLAENGRDCIVCGGIFNNSRGVIQSQNFPFHYPAEQNCKWTVLAWPDHYLRISITDLHIYYSNRCTVDFLKVGKGHFPNQRRLCDLFSDITYIVEGDIYFRFRSRNSGMHMSGNFSGFHLEYSQVHSSDLEAKYVTINHQSVDYDERLWILSS